MKKLITTVRPSFKIILSVDGAMLKCRSGQLSICIQNRSLFTKVLVLDELLPHFDLMLGMDIIQQMGGLLIKDDKIYFGQTSRVSNALPPEKSLIEVEDVDFKARFDERRCIVSWKWNGQAPLLSNSVACYSVGSDIREKWESEVQSWIDEGILKPVPNGVKIDSLVPLMAVSQPNKGKVRPVMDFREINKFVANHPGNCDVCDEKLRSWREIGDNITILDLRKAYLQLHVEDDLARMALSSDSV